MWGAWKPRFHLFFKLHSLPLLSSQLFFSILFCSLLHKAAAVSQEKAKLSVKCKQMALQVPTKSLRPASPLAPSGNVGLRAPSDRFALKSAFFSPSLNLLLPSRQQLLTTSTAPRFSMRVASKQAYICRDCGYSSLSFLFFVCCFSLFYNLKWRGS